MAACDPSAPFAGRDAELAILSDVWAATAEGRLRVVLIPGEAGIGKTTFISEAVHRAARLGFTIHRKACFEHEQEQGFAALPPELVLGRDEKDVGGVQDVSASHFRMIEGLVTRLETAALDRPLALVIDDLQWADPATLAALSTLAARLPYVAVAVVVAYRPGPRGTTFMRTIAKLLDGGARQIALAPLDRDASAALAAHALNATPDDRLLQVVAGAHGNPFYILELLDSLTRASGIAIEGGKATLVGDSLPTNFRGTIVRRLSFLTDDALQILRVAAMLGSSFSVTHLATAADRRVTSLVRPVDECIGAGLLKDDGAGGLRFRHDLVRESIYLDLPSSLRAGLHTEIARKLAEAGAPPSLVANQYAAGAQPGDLTAIEALRQAASAEPSPETSAQLLQRAADLAGPLPSERGSSLADLTDVLLAAGRHEETEAIARELLHEDLRPAIATRVRSNLLRALQMAARFRDVDEEASRWLSDIGIDATERGALLAARSFARGVPSTGSQEALRDAEEALAIAEQRNNDAMRFSALRALAQARGRLGDGPGQLEAAQEAFALAEADSTGLLDREHPHLILAQAWADIAFRDSFSLGVGRIEAIERCERVVTEGLRARERRGTLWDLPLYLTLLARVRFNQGHLDEAMAQSEAAIAAAAEAGSLAGVVDAHLLAAQVLLRRGALDEMERHVSAAEALVSDHGDQANDPRRARLVLHLFRVEWDAVAECAWRIFSELGEDGAPWSPYLMTMAFVATEQPDRALAVCDHAAAWAARTGTRDAAFQADFSRALAEPDVAWLLELLDVPESDAPAPDSGIWLWTACILAREGRQAEATRAVKLAVDSFEDAAPFIAETYARIARQWGVRFRLRRSPRRASVGWDALTGSERNIAELAAQGLTNPEIGDRLFISRRTVQAHLRSVFQKLGISSRVELAAAYGRRHDRSQASATE